MPCDLVCLALPDYVISGSFREKLLRKRTPLADNTAMHWRGAFLLILSCMSLSTVSSAQVRVTMRIPSMTHLALGDGAAELRTLDQRVADGRSSLLLQIRPDGNGGIVNIPLVARSNTPYRLVMRLVDSETTEEAFAVQASEATPYLGTAHLMADATAVSKEQIVVSLSRLDTPILEGARISRGGNNGSRDNALSIRLQLSVPSTVSTATIFVEMQPLR